MIDSTKIKSWTQLYLRLFSFDLHEVHPSSVQAHLVILDNEAYPYIVFLCKEKTQF